MNNIKKMKKMTDSFFYHIYPLGFCGCPEKNDFSCPAGHGLRGIEAHVPRLLAMGVNAVYIGPVFESTAHGYDTLDYFHVDRRLGDNESFKRLVQTFHENGIIVVLDAVLNHAGRHFFAFKDLQAYGERSAYRDWFSNVRFNAISPCGDNFTYDGWNGHYNLVKFNSRNRDAREHLFAAVKFWIEEFGVDGLRLDAADRLSPEFMDELSDRCAALKKDFWLMGEVVAGDYRNWLFRSQNIPTGRAKNIPCRFHSVTNYELYKGLWSSFNDKNFFEIAWTLRRQFGDIGLYRESVLYNFADNHDVNRVASSVKNKAHLFPLYTLLFTVPGVPSIYYGSEFGVLGERGHDSDRALRPSWDAIRTAETAVDRESLLKAIADFARIRKNSLALREGSYRELYVSSEQFAFMREKDGKQALVAVNASDKERVISINAGDLRSSGARWKDALNCREFHVSNGALAVPVHPSWASVLEPAASAIIP
ncbi:MAG: alpha-amylase [Treponema sp.]|jgi:glycosidase|nr:alpha-amylase [Treponema sp.]